MSTAMISTSRVASILFAAFFDSPLFTAAASHFPIFLRRSSADFYGAGLSITMWGRVVLGSRAKWGRGPDAAREAIGDVPGPGVT